MCPKYTAKAILALTLALTLSVKIAVGPTIAGIGATTRGEAPMAAFLERHGFNVGAPLPNIDPPMIPASKAGCTYRITQVDPGGVLRDVLAQLAGPSERLFFVFRGKVFVSQPTWATFLDYKWRRLLGYVGLPAAGEAGSRDHCVGRLHPPELALGRGGRISLRVDNPRRLSALVVPASTAVRRVSDGRPLRAAHLKHALTVPRAASPLVRSAP